VAATATGVLEGGLPVSCRYERSDTGGAHGRERGLKFAGSGPEGSP
jgi:hypothetical protein